MRMTRQPLWPDDKMFTATAATSWTPRNERREKQKMSQRKIVIDVDTELFDQLEQQSLTETYLHLANSVRSYEDKILRGMKLEEYQREDYNADKRFFLAMDTLLDWFFTLEDRKRLRSRVGDVHGDLDDCDSGLP